MSGTVSFTSVRSALTNNITVGTCKVDEFAQVVEADADKRAARVSARQFTDSDGSLTMVALGENGGFYTFTPNVVA